MAIKIDSKSDIDAKSIESQYIDNLIETAQSQRLAHERRWFDNNFFDDGHHFRYVLRTTGRIIDTSDKLSRAMPARAIPKASRQIRGVANLLLAPEYRPAAYPDESLRLQNPESAKQNAQRIGYWLEDEWDNLRMKQKLMHMLVLASKQSVSYLKLWVDDNEKFQSAVRDAFDVYVLGNYTELEDSPFLIEAVPKRIEEITANERFDEEARSRLTADNKYASSEVKQAYLRSRFGQSEGSAEIPTLIQKEAFLKTIITEENESTILRSLEKRGEDLTLFEKGDTILRHVFTAGGETLLDEYLGMNQYPYVDFRFEPGLIYQVPLIERFIPSNKSLDIVMSRVERIINTMVSGAWLKRKGENFDITNVPGGQVLEYSGTPPVQANMAGIPSHVFNYIELVNKQIEEQGASTSALGNVPQGVKSGVAIESIKATEFANLKMPSDMLKDTIRRIAEEMIYLGADFVSPRSVMKRNRGEIESFTVLGERGRRKREELDIRTPEQATIIQRGQKVDIEVETGLGFTYEGKKQTMQQIVQFMIQLAEMGYLTRESVKVVLDRFLESYQFGATQEFMDALDEGVPDSQLSEEQIQQMKVAIAEVMRDLGVGGQEQQEQQVQTSKLGVAEAMRDIMGGGGDANT